MPDKQADKTFVEELEEGEYVQSPFLVRSRETRTTKHDDPYLCITLVDRSGEIEGRVWDDVEMLGGRFEAEDFVEVRGTVDSYQDNLQLRISDIRRLDEESVELSDYLPHSRWSADEMFEQLLQLIDRHVRSDAMRRFFSRLFQQRDIVEAFKRAPAAKSNHHDYFGGLLEHCLSMARLGVRLSRHYARYYPGFLDQDLVVAGCILHDIGKIEELSYDRAVDYSTDGKMIGHITQGVELVTAIASELDPPLEEDLVRHLKHLILSHHGRREYGSPVEPKTPEAMLLHHIDMIDSRMSLMHGHLEEHRNGMQGDADWTGYHGALERALYAGPADTPDWARPLEHDEEALEGPGMLTSGSTAEEGADETSSHDEADDEEALEDDHATLDMFGD